MFSAGIERDRIKWVKENLSGTSLANTNTDKFTHRAQQVRVTNVLLPQKYITNV